MLIKDETTGTFHAPAPGEVFKNPTLGQSLRAVAEQGKKGFYEGRIAQSIVDRSSSFLLLLSNFDQKLMMVF